MDNSDLIRENIRKYREQKLLTQADMAEMLAMSVTGYAKIERGETGLDAKRLYQIASALEVGLWDLMPNTANDGAIVFNNSNDNFSNSSHFSLSFGNPALAVEIEKLHTIIDFKDKLIAARDSEIDSLKSQIDVLQKLITVLEK